MFWQVDLFLSFLLLLQQVALARRKPPYPTPHRIHSAAIEYPYIPVKAVDCIADGKHVYGKGSY